MTYVWFNPVVINMYGWEQLEYVAKKTDLQPIQCKEDWGNFVKDRYRQEIADSKKTILDMRCPKAVDYIKNNFPVEEYVFPDIEPILLHCAREVQRYLSEYDELIVITPCKELAVSGNNLELKNTTFLPFTDLRKRATLDLIPKELEESPIPPGFFSKISKKSIMLTGQDQIHAFFSKSQKINAEVIELLYCPQGCHKGPGVRE